MIDYLEIRDDKHMMCAEGTADDQPNIAEILQAIKNRGYGVENISISHDGSQQTWRFTARLVELLESNRDDYEARTKT